MQRSFRNFSILISLLVFIIISFSCSKKEIKIPKGILTRQELVPVLADIHLAQAAVGMSQFNDSARTGLNEYTVAIFKAHHITRATYDSSLAFYTGHPDLLDEIYQEVINELSKRQGEVSAK